MQNDVQIARGAAINARRSLATESNLGVIINPRRYLDFECSRLLNLFTAVCLPLMALVFLTRLVRGIAGRPVRRAVVRPVWIWTLLAVVVLFWILRNVPVYPFTLLAP